MATAVKAHQGWIDNSAEKTRTQLYFARPDNLTIVGITDMESDMDTVRLAMDTLTLLNETRLTYEMVAHTANPVPPASVLAQREGGIRFTYSDSVTGKLYRFDLPGVDQSAYRTSGTDDVDLTQTDIATFVSAFNAHCVSPDGNAVTIVSGRFYGKNN